MPVLLIAFLTATSGATLVDYVGTAGVVFGIAAALGAAAAVFRSKLATQNIQLLQIENDTLRRRVTDLEKADAAREIVIKAQNDKLAIFQELATGHESIEKLAVQIKNQHAELMVALAAATRPRGGTST